MEHLLSKVLKTSKKLTKRLKKLKKPVFLVLLGIIIFSFGLFHYLNIRRLSFWNEPAPLNITQKGEFPTQVIIPSLKIDIPIESGSIKDGVWEISYSKATFLDSSARPGIAGNTVIYGHNKKALFGNLPYLSIGQKIFVKTADGKMHAYEIYKKDFVKPDRIDLVSPTDYAELTLFTCWGLFDSQRVVVKAKPI